MLTQEERQEVDRIKDAIDLGDSASIVQYGNRAQKNIADFLIVSSATSEAVISIRQESS